MAEKIKFDGNEPSVTTNKEKHPISFGEKFKVNNEYEINLYSFTDEKGKDSDGAVFEIEARGSTSVMKITDPNFACERIAVKGNGWFLGVSPEGEVVTYNLDADFSNGKKNPQIGLSSGWVDCFIAGDDGMDVVDVSTPPFDPKMEEKISINSPDLPPLFWNIYKQMKQI